MRDWQLAPLGAPLWMPSLSIYRSSAPRGFFPPGAFLVQPRLSNSAKSAKGSGEHFLLVGQLTKVDVEEFARIPIQHEVGGVPVAEAQDIAHHRHDGGGPGAVGAAGQPQLRGPALEPEHLGGGSGGTIESGAPFARNGCCLPRTRSAEKQPAAASAAIPNPSSGADPAAAKCPCGPWRASPDGLPCGGRPRRCSRGHAGRPRPFESPLGGRSPGPCPASAGALSSGRRGLHQRRRQDKRQRRRRLQIELAWGRRPRFPSTMNRPEHVQRKGRGHCAAEALGRACLAMLTDVERDLAGISVLAD